MRRARNLVALRWRRSDSNSGTAKKASVAGKEHQYHVDVRWTGDIGQGTATYTAFSRDHEISIAGKPVLPGSSDPSFRGSADRYNPGELLVVALSACHMLWYLHLCADAGIVLVGYTDRPHGVMVETAGGGGHFTSVTLHPVCVIRAGDAERAAALHTEAHRLCFLANSMNFPVGCEPTIRAE